MSIRSTQSYAGEDRNAYIHRAWMRRGVPGDAFTGRPQIAIGSVSCAPRRCCRPPLKDATSGLASPYLPMVPQSLCRLASDAWVDPVEVVEYVLAAGRLDEGGC